MEGTIKSTVEKVKNTYKRVSFGLARICKFEELE